MKIYISTCGLLFALATVAHATELLHGGLWHLREADYLATTAGLVVMLGWSLHLLWKR